MGFNKVRAGFLKGAGADMSIFNMHDLLAYLVHWGDYLPAILITLGVATLVSCAIGCCSSPCEDKDDLFHREVY